MTERTNCPNCGAPLKGCGCEYCGTQAHRAKQSGITVTADAICLFVSEDYDRRVMEHGVISMERGQAV